MYSDEEWFDMKDKGRQGVSISQIAREENVDWRTAKKYSSSKTPPRYKKRVSQTSKLDPHKEYIKSRLDKWPLNAQKLFEEIQECGYTGSYGLVRDFVRPIKIDKAVLAEIRYETKPGIQSQVDWFQFGRVEQDGKVKRLWCFSLILGFSRTRFITYTTDVKTETFIQCHLDAFRFCGGYTKEILYDNTKNVVIKRALKSSDSEWNRLFKDFFTYYGFTPRLCKPGIEGAKTKGKIENTGKFIRGNFFMGLDFSSLPDLNAKAIGWCNKVNLRVHGTTNEIPYERLKGENLFPIDSKPPYQIVLTKIRTVSRDCYISYDGNKYSVPWKYAGREAKLLITNGRMDVEIGGDIIWTHDVVEGSHRRIKIKKHFAGLQKEILDRNKKRHIKRLAGTSKESKPEPAIYTIDPHPDIDVQKRDLNVYDSFTEGAEKE